MDGRRRYFHKPIEYKHLYLRGERLIIDARQVFPGESFESGDEWIIRECDSLYGSFGDLSLNISFNYSGPAVGGPCLGCTACGRYAAPSWPSRAMERFLENHADCLRPLKKNIYLWWVMPFSFTPANYTPGLTPVELLALEGASR